MKLQNGDEERQINGNQDHSSTLPVVHGATFWSSSWSSSMPNAVNRLYQKAAELLAFEDDDDDSDEEDNGVVLILI